MKKRITLGLASTSKSKSKAKATQDSFLKKGFIITEFVTAENIISGVPDQPIGKMQARKGAINRARHMRRLNPYIDWIVSIESAIIRRGRRVIECSYIAMEHQGVLKTLCTCEVPVPRIILDYMDKYGVELGVAYDALSDQKDSKRGDSFCVQTSYGDVCRHDYLCITISLLYGEMMHPLFKRQLTELGNVEAS